MIFFFLKTTIHGEIIPKACRSKLSKKCYAYFFVIPICENNNNNNNNFGSQ